MILLPHVSFGNVCRLFFHFTTGESMCCWHLSMMTGGMLVNTVQCTRQPFPAPNNDKTSNEKLRPGASPPIKLPEVVSCDPELNKTTELTCYNFRKVHFLLPDQWGRRKNIIFIFYIRQINIE